LSVVSAWKVSFSLSPSLKVSPTRILEVALQRADPALLETTTVIGSRSIIASARCRVVDLGRFGEGGAALAERRLRAELLLDLADLLEIRRPLLVSRRAAPRAPSAP
jgi:hypothetical protein